jgi:hypothetical protein
MSDNWKNVERNVAKMLGGKRVPLSGANNTFANGGDVEHPFYFIEVKQRKTLAISDWFYKMLEDMKKNKQEHKTPLLVLHKHNMKKYLAVSDIEFFQECYFLVNAIKQLDTETQSKIKNLVNNFEIEFAKNGKIQDSEMQ